MAPSYRSASQESLYRRFEREKKRKYNERILEIEHASFTPMVFSTLGGCGKEATRAIKQLADRISEKQNSNYAHTVTAIRLELSFAIVKATALCIRGSRSVKIDEQGTVDVTLDRANCRIAV